MSRLLIVILLITIGHGLHSDVFARHPNIVFILADDLGIGDVKCYGGEERTHEDMHYTAR